MPQTQTHLLKILRIVFYVCENCVFGRGVNTWENVLWDLFGFGLENLRAFTAMI